MDPTKALDTSRADTVLKTTTTTPLVAIMMSNVEMRQTTTTIGLAATVSMMVVKRQILRDQQRCIICLVMHVTDAYASVEVFPHRWLRSERSEHATNMICTRICT